MLYGHDLDEKEGRSAVIAGCQSGAGSGGVCTEYDAEQLEWESDANKRACASIGHKPAAFCSTNFYARTHIIATGQT